MNIDVCMQNTLFRKTANVRITKYCKMYKLTIYIYILTKEETLRSILIYNIQYTAYIIQLDVSKYGNAMAVHYLTNKGIAIKHTT